MARGLAGMIALCLLAWLFSENKKLVRIQQICGGLLIQLVIAALLLKLPFSKNIFLLLNKGVLLLQEATQAGTSFAFGYIGGGDLPFTEPYPGAGFILAFQALPIILVMSALSALLTYWRILPALVRLFSSLFQKTMGIGGALAVGAAANIFIGMIES
ncbi:MAG: nucleoside:proton symporter, partial [Candidatus Electrothrix sp. AW1]|nr:nucleoside:proton symporter [Candidatus Electrothrix gigas]